MEITDCPVGDSVDQGSSGSGIVNCAKSAESATPSRVAGVSGAVNLFYAERRIKFVPNQSQPRASAFCLADDLFRR